MKLLATVAMLVALIASGAGCGGGSSRSTTMHSTAASHVIEKLLRQATKGPSGGPPTVGMGGKVLTPQEARKLLWEMRQGAGSGDDAENQIGELLKTLQSAH